MSGHISQSCLAWAALIHTEKAAAEPGRAVRRQMAEAERKEEGVKEVKERRSNSS